MGSLKNCTTLLYLVWVSVYVFQYLESWLANKAFSLTYISSYYEVVRAWLAWLDDCSICCVPVTTAYYIFIQTPHDLQMWTWKAGKPLADVTELPCSGEICDGLAGIGDGNDDDDDDGYLIL
ncbi:hypothetical protein DFH27DRAFT_103260 [Peziza echinospora]|nr:hypothetical protein DFH27DRAFT_103260 [Peziza echinospora]